MSSPLPPTSELLQVGELEARNGKRVSSPLPPTSELLQVGEFEARSGERDCLPLNCCRSESRVSSPLPPTSELLQVGELEARSGERECRVLYHLPLNCCRSESLKPCIVDLMARVLCVLRISCTLSSRRTNVDRCLYSSDDTADRLVDSSITCRQRPTWI